MEKVSKNFYKGKEITDFKEIEKLALEKRSVIILLHWKFTLIRPASFILGWPLRYCLQQKFYYSIKDNGLDF